MILVQAICCQYTKMLISFLKFREIFNQQIEQSDQLPVELSQFKRNQSKNFSQKNTKEWIIQSAFKYFIV